MFPHCCSHQQVTVCVCAKVDVRKVVILTFVARKWGEAWEQGVENAVQVLSTLPKSLNHSVDWMIKTAMQKAVGSERLLNEHTC